MKKSYLMPFYACAMSFLLMVLPLLSPAQNLADSTDAAQGLVEVIVNPYHSNWIYKTGENVKFKIAVRKGGSPVSGLKVSYEIGPEKMEPYKTDAIVLKNGSGVVDGGTMTTPGFLRCIVTAKVDGKTYKGLGTAGFDPEKIKATAVSPDDFLSFWSKTKADAAKVPLNAKMTLVAERSEGDVNVYNISYQINETNSRIYGVLCVPKKQGKYPAYIRFPGAGVRGYSGSASLAAKGMITLDIGIHGIPVNLNSEVYNGLLRGALSGYPLFNLDSRDRYYFKRVIQGCLKSVDFIYSLPQFDGSTLSVMGSSQGGALSIITTALEPRIKYLVALCPALSDLSGYLNGRAGGWPHMFSKTNIAAYGTPEKIKTSSYYDVVNFARLIKVPGYYSWGFNDETTPPTSIYSAYNSISAPKELFIIPDGKHKIYPEQVDKYSKWIMDKMGLNK